MKSVCPTCDTPPPDHYPDRRGKCDDPWHGPSIASSTFVRVNSHRAGERLRRLLGVEKLDYHYTMKTGGCLVPISGEMVEAARRIPSVTVARLTDTPRRCW